MGGKKRLISHFKNSMFIMNKLEHFINFSKCHITPELELTLKKQKHLQIYHHSTKHESKWHSWKELVLEIIFNRRWPVLKFPFLPLCWGSCLHREVSLTSCNRQSLSKYQIKWYLLSRFKGQAQSRHGSIPGFVRAWEDTKHNKVDSHPPKTQTVRVVLMIEVGNSQS